MDARAISPPALQRLPNYLAYLRQLPKLPSAPANISSAAIASALGYGEIQVRKDLAAVSGAGKPKVGYIISDLISDLEEFLGYNHISSAIVAGCGKLGSAILNYSGFREYGLDILAGFDTDQSKTGKTDSGKEIFPMDQLQNLCRRMKIQIGIIATPAGAAQQVCSLMADSGIKAILNFAPTLLKPPDGILIKNENIAVALAELSVRLTEHESLVMK